MMKIETRAVHGCRGFDPHTGAVSFPIYQSATFRHPGLNESTGYDYSRLQNPTREELEDTIALLENGKKGFAFSSGMAAISTVLTLFPMGSHIIATDDLYGGTYRIFQEIFKNYGIEFSYIDTCHISEIEKAIKPNTKAIFIETPSNPMMKVSDISLIAELAKANGILTIVDNTFLTPYLQRPIEWGADIVIHSGTKYLAGHNDTLSGFVVSNRDEITERLLLIQKSQGAVLAPFDSWLLLRGIKTLGVRLDRQQQNTMIIANWLKAHKKIEKVYYVGLPEHEGHEISKKQASGFGAMLSFSLKDAKWVGDVLKKVKVIIFAESLGGVESLITYPVVQTHDYIPKNIRDARGVTDKLLRLSVGIEHIDDLIADLEQALSD
jgi:cystathionine gamma-synthase